MENERKCYKCGCSLAKDGVKLFRSPKPGVTNLIRCLLWARYIFPEKENASLNFQNQLHSEHRMLCQRHFKDADFTDDSQTKLLRTAIPNDVLYQCFEAGINVAAIVCDMDGVNKRALTILGSTVQHPYIQYNKKEIVTFFDPPHLLKCFRNMFMKYNIEMTTHISSDGLVGKGIAKWSHIKEFYEMDSTNPNFVYAPVIKKDHLDPNSKQKMKVNLAAQMLSHSVAGGMLARISNGSIGTEAVVTANLVEGMDKLFDLMNADSTDLRRGIPHSTNWSSTSPHTEFFGKMKVFFQSMKFIGSPRRPPSQPK